ncbi:NAD(P)/FAD-dependent oxidoreductase [Sorangium sp. So ce426]|uniref:NAD(P)/FAD-dependent oxidoreductase n=1 Tax=unclassified Sorangium TaxID=2621164 RepID=UPI003F5AF3E2
MNLEPSDVADTDVVVAGAGIVGLITALQLVKRGLKVTIIDDIGTRKQTFKVGESTLVFTNGFIRTIGELDAYCTSTCQPKIGVAFIEGMEGTTSMKDKNQWALLHTIPQRWIDAFENPLFYRSQLKDVQLVRHEVEALMADTARKHPSITFMDTARVREVDIHEDGTPHVIQWQASGSDGSGVVRTRWVVDCTGRARKLAKLRGHASEHREMNDGFQTTAIWGQFSGIRDDMFDQEWEIPADEGVKYDEHADLTTLHLWGDGYWIWVIRLDSGRISVGVTYDQRKPLPGRTPKEQFWGIIGKYPIFDKVLFEETLLEFKMYKNVQYMTDTFVHEHRYAMVGDAASIIDAYYSQGMSLAMAKSWHITNVIEDDIKRKHLDREYIEHINRHGRQDWHLMRNTIKEKYTSAISDGRFFMLSHWLDMCMVIGLSIPRHQLNRWLVDTGGYVEREQPVHERLRGELRRNLFFTRALPWRLLPPEKVTRLQAHLQRQLRDRALWRRDHGVAVPTMRSILRPAATAPKVLQFMFPGEQKFVDISPRSIKNEPGWMRIKGTEESPVMLRVAGVMTIALFGVMYGFDAVDTALRKAAMRLGLRRPGRQPVQESQQTSADSMSSGPVTGRQASQVPA